MKRDRELLKAVEKYGGERLAFKDLPETHRDALHRRNDECGYPQVLEKQEIGIVTLPMDLLTRLVMRPQFTDAGKDFATFEEYHEWYLSTWDRSTRGPRGSSLVWPVILDFYGDVIEDGWHRFHDYYRRGLTEVPAVYY